MSFGGYYSGTPCYLDELSKLASLGVTLVAAAGNDNKENRGGVYPCDYKDVVCVIFGATE